MTKTDSFLRLFAKEVTELR